MTKASTRINAGGGGSRGRSSRNSSIELLRIIAMFMILAHHFAVHNSYDYTTMEAGPARFLIQLFLESSGKVGVVVFFTISAWYFLDRSQTVKGCVRRVWQLEKEVLFYSVALAGICLAIGFIGAKQALESLMPLTLGQWWYPTAYTLFLLFLPFLERGLRGMGRDNHLRLCLVMLVIYGIVSLIPKAPMVSGVYAFIYIFVLVSAYRWYLEGKHPLRPWPMIVVGTALIAVGVAASMAAWQLLGLQLGITQGDFLTREARLPVILVGFGLFLLFERMSFHSRIVNLVASGAFAVYLITDFPVAEQHLWGGPLDLGALLSEPLGFLYALGALALIYLSCTAIDLARQALFRVTVDKVWGNWFEQLWEKAGTLSSGLTRRLSDDA